MFCGNIVIVLFDEEQSFFAFLDICQYIPAGLTGQFMVVPLVVSSTHAFDMLIKM